MALKSKNENEITTVQGMAVEVLRTLDEHGPNGDGLLWWPTVVSDAVIERCHEIAAGAEVLKRDVYPIGIAYNETVGRIAMMLAGDF